MEVVLAGDELEDVKTLYFSDARLKAELVPPPPPDPKVKNPPPHPLKFKITIPADMPVGIYDMRAIGKWGISNPRAFVVGDLKEVMETEANNDLPQAQKVELNSTINGTISAGSDVDFSVFTGKKGQRVIIYCAGSSVDSKINPLLEIYNSKGQRLGSNRNYFDRNALIDVILPEDGDYFVRLCQFAYNYGGASSFYRLSISTAPWIDAVYPPAVEAGKPATVTLYGRNLPGGKLEPQLLFEDRPLEKVIVQVTPPMLSPKDGLSQFKGWLLPSMVTLDGFEYRVKNMVGSSNPILLTYSDTPVVLDNDKNNTPETAQKINVPATVCGIIEDAMDQDWYVFSAKKGEIYTFEGFGDRLGVPHNFNIQLRRLDGKDNPIVGTFDSHPEIPPANQGFTMETEDPKGRFVIPADGEYQMLIASQTALSRHGPRFVYRVNVRKEQPDYRLVLVNNDTDNAGSFLIHKGGCQELTVMLLRQDGFDGEVLLEVEGLPSGVTSVPQVVGPKIKKGVLVFQATENAADWAGAIKIKGTALIDGKKVERPAQTACLVWPAPQNVPAISRLTHSLCMAVREKGPYVLDTDTKDLAIPVGGNGEVKIKLKRYASDFKAQVQLVRLSAPALTNGQLINVPNVNIDANKNDAVVKFTVPNNTVPGTYTLVFQGKAKYNYQTTSKDKKKKNTDVYESSPPVKVVVYDQIAEVSVASPKLTVKAGENVEVPVKIKRLNDFKGEFEVSLTVPGGFAGITADKLKIPANASEGKLILKTAKNATVNSNPNFLVKVSGKIGNSTFTSETKFELTITKATAFNAPGRPDAFAQFTESRLLPTVVVTLKGE